MSGFSNNSSSTGSTVAGYAQQLAAVLGGASTAYLDQQNGVPVSVTEPVPGTAYGLSGYSQMTPSSSLLSGLAGGSSALLIVGVVVVAIFLLRR